MKLLRRIEKKLKSNYKTASIYNKIAILGKKRNFRKNYFNNEIDDKLVLFESFMGRKYACSPKAIYEYMLSDERFKDYKFVWAFKKPDDKKNNFFDERTTLIKYNRDKYFEVISKAKYWITNSRIPETIIKKDAHNNAKVGNVLLEDSYNNFIYSTKAKICCSNIKNLLIVENNGTFFITAKDKIVDLKDILNNFEIKVKENNFK